MAKYIAFFDEGSNLSPKTSRGCAKRLTHGLTHVERVYIISGCSLDDECEDQDQTSVNTFASFNEAKEAKKGDNVYVYIDREVPRVTYFK